MGDAAAAAAAADDDDDEFVIYQRNYVCSGGVFSVSLTRWYRRGGIDFWLWPQVVLRTYKEMRDGQERVSIMPLRRAHYFLL